MRSVQGNGLPEMRTVCVGENLVQCAYGVRLGVRLVIDNSSDPFGAVAATVCGNAERQRRQNNVSRRNGHDQRRD